MYNIMMYKGYIAEIKYSEEDECFCGKIEGLKNDVISFEGQTVKELKKDFEEAVDHYLMVCEETNTKPEQQCKGSLNVRIGPELHTKARIRSKQENISLNELIKRALTVYLQSN